MKNFLLTIAQLSGGAFALVGAIAFLNLATG